MKCLSLPCKEIHVNISLLRNDDDDDWEGSLFLFFQIPTMESLEAAKLKQREEQLMKRLKVKEKLELRKERREREQATKEVQTVSETHSLFVFL